MVRLKQVDVSILGAVDGLGREISVIEVCELPDSEAWEAPVSLFLALELITRGKKRASTPKWRGFSIAEPHISLLILKKHTFRFVDSRGSECFDPKMF